MNGNEQTSVRTSRDLSPVWLQAAVLGSLWAASEIVLGSFLHNLHLPFRSMLLAAIGVTLMVALGRKWKTRGVFWRAALICALMKSVSPSGVIINPMIAILAQGLLMELATRIGRMRFVAFLFGGMLALCWNLLHFLLYQWLVYGSDIVDIYKKLFQMVTEVIPLPEDAYWLPIYVSLGLHLLFGIGAVLLAYWMPADRAKRVVAADPLKTNDVKKMMKRLQGKDKRSPLLLLLSLVLWVSYLVLTALLAFPWNLLVAVPPLTFWFIRYRHSLTVFKRPLFWILFFIISFGCALVMERSGPAWLGLSLRGIWLGLSVNLHALTFVTGLMVIGHELSGPKIKKRLTGPRLRNLLLAMEAASQILPELISRLPSAKVFLRYPGSVLSYQLLQAEYLLTALRVSNERHTGVIIISGQVHSGKTSLLMRFLELIQDSDLKLGGFVCPAVFENAQRQGYDLLEISTGKRQTLARKNIRGELQIGDYVMFPQALEQGKRSLEQDDIDAVDILILDEIGPWEISGNGWADSIPAVLMKKIPVRIFVVREPLMEAVCQKWNLTDPFVIAASETSAESLKERVLEMLTHQK